MICPLIENGRREFLDKRAQSVLRYNGCAAFADEIVNAVIDLFIDVIRSAAKNDNGSVFSLCFLHEFKTLEVDLLHEGEIFVISLVRSLFDILD